MKYIKEDLVFVTPEGGSKKVLLAWGDPVEIITSTDKETTLMVHDRGAKPFKATVKGKLPVQSKPLLQFSMIDVQQGDGMIVKTPSGKIIFIDGGDNVLFARFAAARFRGSSKTNPLEVDAMIVTHGDADHFFGLNDIVKSEKHETPRKRLFMHPKRVFHNGLVKGPGSLGETKMFGATVKSGDNLKIVSLHDDPRDAAKKNVPFTQWCKSLDHWDQRRKDLGLAPIAFHRVAHGGDEAFDFLEDDGIKIEVHGPIASRTTYRGKKVDALPFLNRPSSDSEMHLGEVSGGSKSASHTINGHSIAFRMVYGNVRFNLTGDLNNQSMSALLRKVGEEGLVAEIVKAPHHGSADFHMGALSAMKPVVSIISSGDESAKKEHIHPRATLMGALGKVSRTDTPIILCTELAAFFAMRGWSTSEKKKRYFGFERTNFGIIQIRTDGKRVLVFTHSGDERKKEAYAFKVDANHNVTFEKKVKKRS